MYSQLNEEEIIVNWFGGKVGRYLDIGAWDGIQMSNTRRLAELGWSGVLVEPGAKNFAQLIENMAFAADRSVLIQAAVSETRGLAQLWFDTQPERGWAATICKDIAENPLLLLTPSRMSCRVPTITPEDLAAFGPYDFLCVDAEGKDLDILRATPASMFESISLVIAEVPRCKEAATEFLASHGYRVHAETTCNVLFSK